jgi:uncharacterized protein with HEPN domain
MPRREWEFRVEDILQALDKIAHYTAGLDRAAFCADEKTIDAVLRNLEIIGEAAANISVEIQSRHADLPWHRMRGLRNLIAHEYFGVDLNIIWQTVQEDLPPLRPRLQALLTEDDQV